MKVLNIIVVNIKKSIQFEEEEMKESKSRSLRPHHDFSTQIKIAYLQLGFMAPSRNLKFSHFSDHNEVKN